MSGNTVRLHRVLRATPDRVYRAFLDADAMVKWLPPHGFTGKVHEMDAREGGGYRMAFTNFTTGRSWPEALTSQFFSWRTGIVLSAGLSR